MKRARRRKTTDIEIQDETPASPAGVSVSGAQPCGMTEGKWAGYPHFICLECRVDTVDPNTAKAARRVCKRNSTL